MSGASAANESGLRYRRGEMLSAPKRADGSDFVEHVALGFRREDILPAMDVAIAAANFADDETLSARLGMTVEDDVVWVDLPNIAKDRRTDFTVAGHEIRRAIEDAHCAPFVLWHSHFSKAGPSDEDWANFPAWLVSLGLVYTVQTGDTIAYGKTVSISDSSVSDKEGSRHG